jgi:hypothetical protein
MQREQSANTHFDTNNATPTFTIIGVFDNLTDDVHLRMDILARYLSLHYNYSRLTLYDIFRVVFTGFNMLLPSF